jgi:hypothetical protein
MDDFCGQCVMRFRARFGFKNALGCNIRLICTKHFEKCSIDALEILVS